MGVCSHCGRPVEGANVAECRGMGIGCDLDVPIATPQVRRQLKKVLDRSGRREKADCVRKTLQAIRDRPAPRLTTMTYDKPADAYQKVAEAIQAGKYGVQGNGAWADNQKHQQEVLEKFSADVRLVYATTDKLHGAAFKKACEQGHSTGLMDVLSVYDDIMEIVEALASA